MTDIPRNTALRILGDLRQGTGALRGATHYSAGREPVFRAAGALLDELTDTGGSAVRWLMGAYGSGKTHVFARLREDAHDRNWIVSYVQVSGKGMGCELHRFEEVYASIIHNCLSPGQANDVTTNQLESGWRWLLDSWVKALKRQAGGKEGGDVQTFRFREAVDGTISLLRRNHGIQGSFSAALRLYANASVDHNVALLELMLDWFAGVDVLKRGSNVKAMLRSEGLMEAVSRRNARSMLRQVTTFVRYRGYKGILILFDEVENVLQLPPSARRSAYTILRELIDNVDERHGMAQTLFYLSATPDLFESEKGIAEYEALASRVLLPSTGVPPNPAAAVVDLAAFPITRADLLTIARKILGIYAAAGYASSIGFERIGLDLEQALGAGALPSPRSWVRTVTDIADRHVGHASGSINHAI